MIVEVRTATTTDPGDALIQVFEDGTLTWTRGGESCSFDAASMTAAREFLAGSFSGPLVGRIRDPSGALIPTLDEARQEVHAMILAAVKAKNEAEHEAERQERPEPEPSLEAREATPTDILYLDACRRLGKMGQA